MTQPTRKESLLPTPVGGTAAGAVGKEDSLSKNLGNVLHQMRQQATFKVDGAGDSDGLEADTVSNSVKRVLLGARPKLSSTASRSRPLLATPAAEKASTQLEAPAAAAESPKAAVTAAARPAMSEAVKSVLPSPLAVSELAKQKEVLNQGPLSKNKLSQPPPPIIPRGKPLPPLLYSPIIFAPSGNTIFSKGITEVESMVPS